MDGQTKSNSDIIRETYKQANRKYKAKNKKHTYYSSKSENKDTINIALGIIEHQNKYGKYIL